MGTGSTNGETSIRLAIAVAGTGAGGAYTAGALARVLERLDEAGHRVAVDIVTGSGSGALNAALAARALCVNPANGTLLRNVWLDGMGFDQLFDGASCRPTSLFDPRALNDLVSALLMADPAADDRSSAGMADGLRLGIAREGARALTFETDPSTGADAGVWRSVRDAAVRGMAVPVFFPGGEPSRATESTGALELARRLAARGGREGERVFLLIDPDLAGGDRKPSTAEQLGRITRGPRAARELGRARDLGARSEVLQGLIRRLPELADRVFESDAYDVGRYVGDLAERVAEARVDDAGGDDDPALALLDSELARIEADPTYSRLLERGEGRAARTRLAKLIFALEAVAGPAAIAHGPLHVLGDREEELAGTRLGGLSGFLERAWREHDFRAGAADADGALAALTGDREVGGAGPSRIPPLSRDGSRSVDRLAGALVDCWLADVRPGGMAAAFGWAWKPAVRNWAARAIQRELPA